MKDLDFDELDKAVNSLMSRSGNAPIQSSQPSPAAPSSTVSQPEDTSSSLSVVPARATTIAPTEPRQPSLPLARSATPSLATKRSGRFMDVVHPSSDMTKAPIVNTPTAEKITLTPISTTVVPETNPESDASEQLPSDTTSQTAPAATVSQNEWPDPLEFHEQQSAQNTTETQLSNDAPDVSPAVVVETKPEAPITTASEPLEPSLSPFIADAKVEKRPLGGTTADEPTVSESNDQTSAIEQKDIPTDQQVSNNDDTQTTPRVELPAELHSDLLAVESDEAAKLPSSSATSASASVDSIVTGPVSIVQQYKKQENSRDTSHTAIYDNAAQPLAHPAKKKSGWLGVVLIIVVILLLVGAAAAAYFMGFIPL